MSFVCRDTNTGSYNPFYLGDLELRIRRSIFHSFLGSNGLLISSSRFNEMASLFLNVFIVVITNLIIPSQDDVIY